MQQNLHMKLIKIIKLDVCLRLVIIIRIIVALKMFGKRLKNREQYMFIDVQSRGEYPSYAKKL